MAKLWFDIGETIICRLVSKKDGEIVSLDAVPTITISNDDGVVINTADMSENVGVDYYYDFTTVARPDGSYRAKITAVYGARPTIINGGFKLH